MTDTSFFFSSRPAYPWSVYPLGLPALAVVAVLLVAFTVWTYLGHPQATRRRVLVILGLRLLALVVALLTAVRPSVGVQEEPKVPSVLLIGLDLSESMTVKDEVNNQARIDAVRKVLERCQPTLDELAAEQNVSVVLYRFSTPDFSPEVDRYDPRDPADGTRSDYGTYLNRTYDRWQGERFLRGHILVGDGADNGTAFSAVAEAARWGKRNAPVHTFAVGSRDSTGDARDIAVVAVSCDPSPAPIKTEVTVTARVNAYNFRNTRTRARVFFNDTEVRAEDVLLTKEQDNEVKITGIRAPETPGEVKVRVEIPALPGEVSDQNNASETYLTVTKEGVRVLLIDRERFEHTFIRRALQTEKRFDVYDVVRQTDLPPTADELQFLDLDGQGYDVVIIGNVSARQLLAADPRFLDKLVERVTKKGMGLMLLGGEAAFTGIPPPPPGDPTTRSLVFADILPVVPAPGQLVDGIDPISKRPVKTFQTVPTFEGLQRSVMKVGKDEAESIELWEQLNTRSNRSRITGYNKFAAKPVATVYAWATPADQVEPPGRPPPNADPLLVGQQFGEGRSGRVLAFGAYDTHSQWMRLGQPRSRQGVEIFNRFWRQCVLWLAHQEEEEGQVYARPEFRRLPIGGDQTIRVGLKTPTGEDDPNAALTVKVLAPGEDEAKAQPRTIVRDKTGAKVLFKPPAAGEYTVVVTAPVLKDGQPVTGPDGQPLVHRGAAKFIAFPDVSDEMIRVAAVPEHLQKISAASGGKALRLEDLPAFLKELKAQPLDTIKPKPKYLPDWRRNHSKGFLPAWLAVFALLLGTEWGLRRLWGMV